LKTARLAPYLFVFLWSTGFVGAKYGLPYADPFIFLSLRIFIAAGILFIAAQFLKAPLRYLVEISVNLPSSDFFCMLFI